MVALRPLGFGNRPVRYKGVIECPLNVKLRWKMTPLPLATRSLTLKRSGSPSSVALRCNQMPAFRRITSRIYVWRVISFAGMNVHSSFSLLPSFSKAKVLWQFCDGHDSNANKSIFGLNRSLPASSKTKLHFMCQLRHTAVERAVYLKYEWIFRSRQPRHGNSAVPDVIHRFPFLSKGKILPSPSDSEANVSPLRCYLSNPMERLFS
jgi:hypothetical protein